jgi:hypothetical protein
MTPTTILLIGILLVLAVGGWLLRRAGRLGGSRQAGNDDIDREVLEEAEEEVRGLDAFTTPDEADDELPDWGPGTAKR